MDMSNATTRSGSLNGRIGLVALLATMCLLMVAMLGASSAKASTIGDPVDVNFNYVGISVEAIGLGGINDLVLQPSDSLGEIEMHGTYTDTNGNFTVNKTGGLTFPTIALDLEGVALNAEIELTKNASGNYNSSTGAMTLNPTISLNIGVSDLGAILDGALGTGPLGCELAPLDIDLSTAGVWPAAGSNFADPGAIHNGALAGAWTVKPDIVATEGTQATCDLVGGLLDTVGGLWLAQNTGSVTYVAAAANLKPPPAVCDEGYEGTPPNCTEIVKPPKPAKVSIKGKVKGVTIKAGKTGKVKVTVQNKGGKPANGVKVCGAIAKKVAKTGCVTLGKIPAGKSKTATLKLKTTKKSKGSSKLKISVSSKGAGKASTKATVKVKASKKKRK